MERKITHIIGIDEAGEKARAAFARGCRDFLKENIIQPEQLL